MDIQQILDDKSIEVSGLLRKHKIAGDLSVDTVNKAYSIKGEQFMMELLRIITPTSSFLGIGKGNGFLGLGKGESSADSVDNADTAEETAVLSGEEKETGRFWTFWDKLLTQTAKTGDTLDGLSKLAKNPAEAQRLEFAGQREAAKNNILYWVAGGFIALIIIILILKK